MAERLAARNEGAVDTIRRLEGYVANVQRLHSPRYRDVDGATLCWCVECQQTWPCKTYKATEGKAV